MPPQGPGTSPLDPAHLDDATLITRIASGDERAFAFLVHTYTLLLVRFATGYLHGYDAAEEIVEDVFFGIWELRVSWQPKTTIRAYLFTAVRNRALDWLKHAAADQRLRDRWRQELDTDPAHRESRQTLDRDDDPDRIHTLRRALATLTDRQREALRLRYEEQLSYRDVAAIMEISESAVDRLLSRAVHALRRAAREGGGEE